MIAWIEMSSVESGLGGWRLAVGGEGGLQVAAMRLQIHPTHRAFLFLLLFFPLRTFHSLLTLTFSR